MLSVVTITLTKSEKDIEKLAITLKSFSEKTSRNLYDEYIIVRAGRDIPIPQWAYSKIKNLRIIKSPVANFSFQRNIGLRESKGELVVFIDDGMELEIGWLESMLNEIDRKDEEEEEKKKKKEEKKKDKLGENRNVVAVCGAVLPIKRSQNIWGRCQGILNHPGGGFQLFHMAKEIIEEDKKKEAIEVEFFHTGLSIVRRDIFLKIGFDESLKYGCEDMDISVRIRQSFPDARFVFTPYAVAYHHTRENLKDIFLWMRRYGKGRTDIYLRHNIPMTGFLIHKLLFLTPTCLITTPLPLLVSVYIYYFLKLRMKSKYIMKYQQIDNKTWLMLPFAFILMNIGFDIGRGEFFLTHFINKQIEKFVKKLKSMVNES